MQETYQQFDETGEVPKVEKEKDPFWEPSETEVIIGVGTVPLNYLSHMLEFQDEEPVTILDYSAKQAGFLQVDLVPCDSSGREDVDLCVDDPMDLVGKSVAFKIKVNKSINLHDRFEKTWCRYKFFDEPSFVTTDQIQGKNPAYNHEKMFRFRKEHVDHKFIEYLRTKSLAIEVWGIQGAAVSSSSKGKRQEEKQRLLEELEQYKSTAESLQEKLDRIRAIVNKMPSSAETKKLKEILDE